MKSKGANNNANEKSQGKSSKNNNAKAENKAAAKATSSSNDTVNREERTYMVPDTISGVPKIYTYGHINNTSIWADSPAKQFLLGSKSTSSSSGNSNGNSAALTTQSGASNQVFGQMSLAKQFILAPRPMMRR